MSVKSPVFPIPEPQNLTDHGFEHHVHYAQVMEQRRPGTATRSMYLKTFKLQKQKAIVKDEFLKKIRMNKKRYLRNALLCLKRAVLEPASRRSTGSISSLVYSTESRRAASIRPGSGPTNPYISLRELNMEQDSRVSAPVYLVT